ncbi:fluoride efflux transporter FluC [Staphylococcus lutrae]|uniref:Fluoride-specific ion channel FluC n=1 Tax=Staphylococcus lutrae TaxID=155085 RepID=A0AAC9RSP6_9STAP|nr:CrcB family protein [Staphylococcus lutrae]ARJ50065.1 chromosome condensation protein CrcB [Staphylococcus lutrae]PNZ38363.1 fluoride efflux transporter CrcB [Staphylococcus lutrae]
MIILMIALGGGLGAVSRAVITTLTQKSTRFQLPIATLIVNWIGAFSIGLLDHLTPLPLDLRLGLITGLLGGLTTFSTLTLELLNMLRNQQWLSFITYSVLQYPGCLFLCMIGTQL